MSLLRFTNARGETLDLRSPNVVTNRIEGASAPAVSTTLIDIVSRPGAGYVRRRVEPRIITITLTLLATPAQTLVATRRAAARTLSPSLGLGVLEYQPEDAGTIYAIDASVARYGGPYERPHYDTTVVQFEAPFPYWRDTTLKQQQIVLSSDSSTTGLLVTAGDVPTWPTVVFGANGTASSASWTNLAPDPNETLSFGSRPSPIEISEQLTVDHLNFTAELEGVNWIDRLTASSVFWALQPGNNTILVSAIGSSLTRTFDFAWYDLFDGV